MVYFCFGKGFFIFWAQQVVNVLFFLLLCFFSFFFTMRFLMNVGLLLRLQLFIVTGFVECIFEISEIHGKFTLFLEGIPFI